jgi:uncharacterized protein
MGKIAIWILVAVAVMLLLRMIGTAKRRAESDSSKPARSSRGGDKSDDPPATTGELMMSCAVCGMHMPSSDAVFARGKVFCSPAHRDQEDSARDDAQG